MNQINTLPVIRPTAEEMRNICPRVELAASSPCDQQRIPAAYATWVAREIVARVERPWRSADDLPANPHLFDYEKDIIDFYTQKVRIGNKLYGSPEKAGIGAKELKKMRATLLNGCPPEWPDVVRFSSGSAGVQNPLSERDVGAFAGPSDKVIVAALGKYHRACERQPWDGRGCMMFEHLAFHEARPRQTLYFPRDYELRVAILVSGGIAPGLNAVIDGIVQRHWTYCISAQNSVNRYSLQVFGLRNGLRAFDRPGEERIRLAEYNHHTRDELIKPILSAEHANDGGCILGTSRVDELIEDELAPPDKRLEFARGRVRRLQNIVDQLRRWKTDILYVIGGDGSMKAAHALWSTAQNSGFNLSVVAVPKTMDNDILWMWQSFGFLSAVEKAREIIQHLHTEVRSNPRLCVLQLFGSDSGFVVSHAVLASATGQCDAAVIPEVPFSMKRLGRHVKDRMLQRGHPVPHGLVVMAETAIPLDAPDYCRLPGMDLSGDEITEIEKFCSMRRRGQRIQGQTNDLLRSAGLKILSRGLFNMLRGPLHAGDEVPEMWHDHLRVVTNEPRHVLRSIPPSCTDIIMGQRLGTLAVDNAMAGFTDFMISQWLTEYVLVPLKLVVLGRKRIPKSGIFWKSVCGKTGQPPGLYDMDDLRKHDPLTHEEQLQAGNHGK